VKPPASTTHSTGQGLGSGATLPAASVSARIGGARCPNSKGKAAGSMIPENTATTTPRLKLNSGEIEPRRLGLEGQFPFLDAPGLADGRWTPSQRECDCPQKRDPTAASNAARGAPMVPWKKSAVVPRVPMTMVRPSAVAQSPMTCLSSAWFRAERSDPRIPTQHPPKTSTTSSVRCGTDSST